MSVPVTPEPTLVVTHREVPRRVTDDNWWEHQERNPETGEETWVRIRPLHPVEVEMREMGALRIGGEQV